MDEAANGKQRQRRAILTAWARGLILVALYALVARLTLLLATGPMTIAPTWPPAGIGLAIILLLGQRYWPTIFFGALLANFSMSHSLPSALALSTVNALTPALGGWLIKRFLGVDQIFVSTRNLLCFIGLTAATSFFLGAPLAALSLVLAGWIRWSEIGTLWWTWLQGDLSGFVIVTPAILSWADDALKWENGRGREFMGLFALSTLVNLIIYSKLLAPLSLPSLGAHLITPILVWAALRLNLRGATTILLWDAAFAILGTAHGSGTFIGSSQQASVLQVQGFLVIISLTTLVLGVSTIERQMTARSLSETDSKLRAVVELAEDIIYIKDCSGHYLMANNAYGTFLQRPPNSLLGATDEQLFDKETAAIMRTTDRQVQESGKTANLEEWIPTPSGTKTYLSIKVPYRNDMGEIIGIIGLSRDITDRKRLEETLRQQYEQLKQLDHLKDLLLSTISHQIKTPLSLINGYAELLQEKFHDEALIMGIMDGCRRLTWQINKILDYSALLTGSLPLYCTEIDLTEIGQAACLALDELPDVQRKQVHCVLDVIPETPSVLADSRRLMQMLFELLENAARYSPSGGTITIQIHPAHGGAEIGIRDEGPGIAHENFEHIWKAFSTADVEGQQYSEGLGLGLAIVQRLAELHDGCVKVQSEPGHGAVFRLWLPAAPTLGQTSS